MNSASFRFYDELNDFIEKDRRNITFAYLFEGNPSTKDCIEAIGVPHTEVEAIKINGIFTDFFQKVNQDDKIEIYSISSDIDLTNSIKLRPEIEDYKFIVDANVGKMAKNLRMLGFDTYYDFDLPDKEIVAVAEREKRIILSRDIGLLKRKNAIYGYFLRKTSIEEQINEVMKRYDLVSKIKPFTICLKCNTSIRTVEKAEYENHIDENTQKEFNEFFKCDECDKFFWKGSHYDKMYTNVDKWTSNA